MPPSAVVEAAGKEAAMVVGAGKEAVIVAAGKAAVIVAAGKEAVIEAAVIAGRGTRREPGTSAAVVMVPRVETTIGRMCSGRRQSTPARGVSRSPHPSASIGRQYYHR